MDRKILSLAGVFLLCAAIPGIAQGPEGASASVVPAASRSEMDCSGFVSGSRIPKDIFVFGGADDDYQAPLRLFATGEFVYLKVRGGSQIQVGAEYSLIRPASYPTRISWYPGQRWSLHTLGKVYEDVGRVKVTRITPQAAIAEVTFACGPVLRGDVAVPYQSRAIPEYDPTLRSDRFAPSAKGTRVGAITSEKENGGFLGKDSIAYVNLGEADGARPGQRYRIFRVFRETIENWLFFPPHTPAEYVGELVILSTQEKSSVAKVVTSSREIYVGDGIEQE